MSSTYRLGTKYYYRVGSAVTGPATMDELRGMVRDKKLSPTVLVCEVGGKEWKSLATVQHAAVMSGIVVTPEMRMEAERALSTIREKRATKSSVSTSLDATSDHWYMIFLVMGCVFAVCTVIGACFARESWWIVLLGGGLESLMWFGIAEALKRGRK